MRPSDKPPINHLHICEVSWQAAQHLLAAIRQAVFVGEQQVPVELEWDNLDATAQHFLVLVSAKDFDLSQDAGLRQDADQTQAVPQQAIACARVLTTADAPATASIGRMAVLPDWRGKGVGRALLAAVIASCRLRHYRRITLSAQTHAISFYEQAGFMLCSEIYMDAGIPHRDMELRLYD